MRRNITLFILLVWVFPPLFSQRPYTASLKSSLPLQPMVTLDSSNIPIVGINTFFQFIPDEPKITAGMGIINNGYNIFNHITDPVNAFSGRIGIEKRGSVSQLWPQASYSIETRDSLDSTMNVSILGMPKEHDWVLYGPYDDHTLMRNVLTYKISRQMGHWAPRTRFCELMLNTFWWQYQGVYVMMEKIKRDNNRVDISKLDSDDNAGDSLTGGYIIAVDKNIWAPDSGFTTSNPPNLFITYKYPNGTSITPQQKNYIKSYVDSFETALLAPNFQDLQNGWRKYAEPNSFIDFFIITELSKNIDAYKRSAYLYKDKYSKGGKLLCGPFWDFNSAWYNAHACGFDADTGWAYPMTCWVNASFPVPFWWTRLLQDSIWTRDLKCRWTTLRSTVLDTTLLFHEIDSMGTYVSQPASRHYLQWGFTDSWQGQLDSLKRWIRLRTAWMDANMPGNCWNLGIGDDQAFGNLFHVYPNPSSGESNLVFFLGTEMKLEIVLYDITGRKLLDLSRKEYPPGNSVIPLALADLAAGTYFLKIDSGTSLTVKKVVVAK